MRPILRGLFAGALLFAAGRVAALGRTDSPPTSVTADFSGAGAVETATARAKGKTVRLEIADAHGKRIARADAPAPGGNEPRIALRTGSIGTVGTILEVEAAAGDRVCRTLWRLRDRALARLPLIDGGATLSDCDAAAAWTTRWDESRNEPATYLRERTTDVPDGKLHETRAFVFAGFEMQRDGRRSGAEVNGVAIPDWPDVVMYPKPQIAALFRRFGLSGLPRAPRLRFAASRERGEFAVLLEDTEGSLRLPVTASKPLERPDPTIELSAGSPPAELAVTLGGLTPRDVSVRGVGPRFDGGYEPVIRWDPTRVRMYPSAEQELASEGLPGTWSTENGERLAVEPAPGPGAVRFGETAVAVRFAGTPAGADVLLVPADGSAPVWALTLRGPNGFSRLPVRCEGAKAAWDCRPAGSAENFRRVGSALNVR